MDFLLAVKNMTATPSAYTQTALEILRRPDLTMHWYIVPIFVLLIYIISVEIHHKNWNILLAGVALWGMDLFNEIWNGAVAFSTGAPVWGTPMGVGDTSLLLLIGYNIEISIMFFLMGLAVGHTLEAFPKDKKILKVNNRIWIILIMTTFAVLVEIFLNYAGILTWEKAWWQPDVPYVLWLIGYLPFFVSATLAHDGNKRVKLITIGSIYFVDIVLLAVFGGMGWL